MKADELKYLGSTIQSKRELKKGVQRGGVDDRIAEEKVYKMVVRSMIYSL